MQPEFWAHVRVISQAIDYTVRGRGTIKVPSFGEMQKALQGLGLTSSHLADSAGTPNRLGTALIDYFSLRATMLNETAYPLLMDKEAAERAFKRLKRELRPSCPLPYNKQKGDKRNYAFLTGIVNMLVESATGGLPCDYDPRSLTTVTDQVMPLRTLSRRVDGAFPSVLNPVAIWEIKEYYYTTTFGSRVADGVYETLLDGMELEELENTTGRKIQHVLFVDDRFTWWNCGRSYLCRIIDMLHMGRVDEVIFGREVFERLPGLVGDWIELYKRSP